jgi:plasmid stability protein
MMAGYYRMDAVPPDLHQELRVAAAEHGISRTSAFERLLGDEVRDVIRNLAAGQARLARRPNNGGDRLNLVLAPESKARLDEAVRRLGLRAGSAGAMILAAHAGRMSDALPGDRDAG